MATVVVAQEGSARRPGEAKATVVGPHAASIHGGNVASTNCAWRLQVLIRCAGAAAPSERVRRHISGVRLLGPCRRGTHRCDQGPAGHSKEAHDWRAEMLRGAAGPHRGCSVRLVRLSAEECGVGGGKTGPGAASARYATHCKGNP